MPKVPKNKMPKKFQPYFVTETEREECQKIENKTF